MKLSLSAQVHTEAVCSAQGEAIGESGCEPSTGWLRDQQSCHRTRTAVAGAALPVSPVPPQSSPLRRSPAGGLTAFPRSICCTELKYTCRVGSNWEISFPNNNNKTPEPFPRCLAVGRDGGVGGDTEQSPQIRGSHIRARHSHNSCLVCPRIELCSPK